MGRDPETSNRYGPGILAGQAGGAMLRMSGTVPPINCFRIIFRIRRVLPVIHSIFLRPSKTGTGNLW